MQRCSLSAQSDDTLSCSPKRWLKLIDVHSISETLMLKDNYPFSAPMSLNGFLKQPNNQLFLAPRILIFCKNSFDKFLFTIGTKLTLQLTGKRMHLRLFIMLFYDPNLGEYGLIMWSDLDD